MLSFLVSLCLIFAAGPVWSDQDASTHPATVVNTYKGGFKDDYPQVYNRVQSYMLPVQSEIAVLLGLQYGQGFIHSVTIRFDDGAPGINENPYFYVQTKGSGDTFAQDVVVNVEAYAKKRTTGQVQDSTLRGGFRYALTEAMLNDFAAGDADKALPLWVQEGLSVYASGNGDAFVQTAAGRVHKSHVGELVGELNRPGQYLTPKEWALYYLAIKYIASIGGLQTFVRDMVSGKSAADTVRENLSQEWPDFEEHVRLFAQQAFSDSALPDEEDSAPMPGDKPHH